MRQRTIGGSLALKRPTFRQVRFPSYKIMTFRQNPVFGGWPRGRRALVLATSLLLGLLMLATGPAQAQKYRTAAGFRLGKGTTGLTIQQKIFDHVTLEGLGTASAREFSGTLLVERHFGILGPSLNYYLGAGGHVGKNQDTGTFGGLDGVIGAEYKIALTHFVLSFDLKPTVEFNSGDGDWSRFPTAFSVRYIILKEKNAGLFRGLRGLFGGGQQ